MIRLPKSPCGRRHGLFARSSATRRPATQAGRLLSPRDRGLHPQCQQQVFTSRRRQPRCTAVQQHPSSSRRGSSARPVPPGPAAHSGQQFHSGQHSTAGLPSSRCSRASAGQSSARRFLGGAVGRGEPRRCRRRPTSPRLAPLVALIQRLRWAGPGDCQRPQQGAAARWLRSGGAQSTMR
jgi:hypothetical protein